MPEELTSFIGTARGDLPSEQAIFGCSAAIADGSRQGRICSRWQIFSSNSGESGSGNKLVGKVSSMLIQEDMMQLS
jgi:hypothetical protein